MLQVSRPKNANRKLPEEMERKTKFAICAMHFTLSSLSLLIGSLLFSHQWSKNLKLLSTTPLMMLVGYYTLRTWSYVPVSQRSWWELGRKGIMRSSWISMATLGTLLNMIHNIIYIVPTHKPWFYFFFLMVMCILLSCIWLLVQHPFLTYYDFRHCTTPCKIKSSRVENGTLNLFAIFEHCVKKCQCGRIIWGYQTSVWLYYPLLRIQHKSEMLLRAFNSFLFFLCMLKWSDSGETEPKSTEHLINWIVITFDT